jgi:hypothetical protein
LVHWHWWETKESCARISSTKRRVKNGLSLGRSSIQYQGCTSIHKNEFLTMVISPRQHLSFHVKCHEKRIIISTKWMMLLV